MFLLPWSTGGRIEKERLDKITSPTALWPRSSVTEGSLLNRMKRKRGSSDDLEHQYRSVKPQRDLLSHINIPVPVNASSDTPNIPESKKTLKGKLNMSHPLEDRTDRMDWQHAHIEHRPVHAQSRGPSSAPPARPSADHYETNTPVARPSSAILQETIEAQFSLEILLKHRELRLIDQEIAKCQIAFEQLRRCQVIPYPAMSSSWGEMQAVASGIGPMQSNDVEHAPAWGVTNGPYTRHYRQWLIPDPAFGDRLTEEMPNLQPSRTFTDRSVRASTAGKSSLTNKSRSQRGQGSTRLQALPHGYPEAKEDKGPMVVKRSTDGKMVKLVCLDCRRADFNSVQGFINHCRIAHSRNFQTHDAAAIACGEEVELDQAGGIIGETSTTGGSGAGLVHPLIRSAHVAKTAAPTPPMNFRRRESLTTFAVTPTRNLASAAGAGHQTPTETPGSGIPATPGSASNSFKPSPQTPHLSALLARIGHGADLHEEVELAKTKVNFDDAISADDEEDEEEDAEVSQPLSGPASHSTRGVVRPAYPPSRTVMAPAQFEHSPTVKPATARSRRPKGLANLASHLTDPSSVSLRGVRPPNNGETFSDYDRRNHDGPLSPNLSPNTVEAYPAPSLISDDDEFENTHSECSSAADVAEDLEGHYLGVDFEGHDEQVMEDIEGAGGSSAGASHLGIGAEFKGNHPPRRSSALRSPDTIRDPTINHGRHVSFASPTQRPRKKGDN
ncbi:MAG: hypothetical protein Q9166_006085 [cf. Caloplaca sp. 2 TL-2023]